MNASFQLDSYHYRCRNCHKSHVGPSRTLDFHCVQEKLLEHGLERIYEADSTFGCACGQRPVITFRVREHPEGNFEYLGYRSVDADIIIPPKVREHMEYVEF